ncbi:MAG: hypothetical protein Q9M28_05280 [Mariprofundaceae bacterium]|nr:hypothetical protein [Mariprofundaceae bacterium]
MQQPKEIYQAGIHPIVAEISFDAIKWKLSESSESKITTKRCLLAEQEYRRYLTLKKLYPNIELVPNKLVDEFWHAHILDTKAYHDDCNKIFGYYIHHFPYFGIYGDDDYQNLVTSFEQSKQLYEKHFGAYPDQLDNASRCADHACHAPSTCACRSPGTCK